MTPNGWKHLSNTWFGTFWVKVVFAMHAHCLHASHIHAIWLSARFSRSEDLLFFLKTKAFAHFSTEILVFTPWSIMPVATFSINHFCPFKHRTCHLEKEHWKFPFTPRVEKNWKRKQNGLKYHKIAQKQSLYNDLFTDSRKNTFRMLKTTEKWHFISQLKFRQWWTKVLGQIYTCGFFHTCQTNSQARIHLHIFSRSSPPPPPLLQCWTRAHTRGSTLYGGKGGKATHFVLF